MSSGLSTWKSISSLVHPTISISKQSISLSFLLKCLKRSIIISSFSKTYIKAINASSESLNPVIFLSASLLYRFIIPSCSYGGSITFLVTLYYQTIIWRNFTHLTNSKTGEHLGAKQSRNFVLFIQGLSKISALA